MRRRQLLAAAFGGILAAPLAARAQEPGRRYRVAYLGPSPEGSPPQRAFIDALGALGFVEGKNLVADNRGYAVRPGQYGSAARELVEAKPDLLVCGGPEPGRAAQQATKTIPILVNTDDMVGEGLVASIAHPGGNTTGVSILSPELDGKRFETLLELLPNARRIDALAGSDTANPQHFAALQRDAQGRGVTLTIRQIGGYDEIAPAVEAAKAGGAAGLNVLGSALLFGNRKVIIERTKTFGLPAIYQWPENAREGGLIGYGPSIVGIYSEILSRMAADILRGANPADIPVERPTRFHLAINLETAKALGLAVPPLLLAQADETIE
ncbi:MAG TPA: ABC transporter substrate-binding protein [Stellaceae bacterium]|nr:ABC transporter substrate-binding protein [Stellaceae bacterium]